MSGHRWLPLALLAICTSPWHSLSAVEDREPSPPFTAPPAQARDVNDQPPTAIPAPLPGQTQQAEPIAADDLPPIVEPNHAERISLQLPGVIDIALLAEMVAQELGVSLQVNPQRVRQQVRLHLRGSFTQAELWEACNQALLGAGFVTVLAGEPAVYQVVPLNEAAVLTRLLTEETFTAMHFPPGYIAVIASVQHLSAEAARQALTPSMAAPQGQVRTLGSDTKRLILQGTSGRVREARMLLNHIDRPGIAAEIATFQPRFASAQRLQSALNAAWTSAGRQGASQPNLEIQVAPDGARLLLITSVEAMAQAQALAQALDASEPRTTRTYAIRHFVSEEVAAMLQSVLKPPVAEQAGPRIVLNNFTNSLIITASSGEHERIAALLQELDDAPAQHRRVLRSFPIQHRRAEELAITLAAVLSDGDTDITLEGPAHGASAQSAQGAQDDRGAEGDPTNEGRTNPSEPAQARPTSGTAAALPPPRIVVDAPNNALLAIASPTMLQRVESIIERLDRRQPQVELEVILLTLSDSQSRTFGMELRSLGRAGSTSVDLGSLFGLSNSGLPQPSPAFTSLTGFGGLIINPGDYSVAIRAFEALGDGRNMVRARVVVNNNADANLDAVLQEPIASINASDNVATTTFGGTSDAGTQLAVTPTIGAGDQVSLAYAITQSAFIGEGTQLNGALLPPTRRADTLSSIATIPDGFAIAVGGIRSQSRDNSRSQIPILGSIPFLGRLFGTRTRSHSDGRFYVFMRARILRHPHLEDLKHLSQNMLDEADVADEGWPILTPRFIE